MAGAWPEAFEMPGKAIWRIKCKKTLGGCSRTMLGKLTALSRALDGGKYSYRVTPALGFSGSALQDSPVPDP